MLNTKKYWVLPLAIPFFMGMSIAFPWTTTPVLAAGTNFSTVEKFTPLAQIVAGGQVVPQNALTITAPKPVDIRVKILQAYLAQYNSPLQGQAKTFVDAADKYGLDWKLVAAISGVESTFGKFTPGSNEDPSYNAWGWGVYGDQTYSFKSWDDGIDTVSKGLKENYINHGVTDPYDINRTYAASPMWGAHVSYFMADMTKFAQAYQETADSQAPLPTLKPQVAASSGLLAIR